MDNGSKRPGPGWAKAAQKRAHCLGRRSSAPAQRPQPLLVNVHDISPEGCRLEFVERPRLDETVWVKFEGLDAIESSVCWFRGSDVGVEFAAHPCRRLRHPCNRLAKTDSRLSGTA